MTCYISSPVGWQVKARRLYFSCKCGMIAARNEEGPLGEPDHADESEQVEK
jgi:hypothetical protein